MKRAIRVVVYQKDGEKSFHIHNIYESHDFGDSFENKSGLKAAIANRIIDGLEDLEKGCSHFSVYLIDPDKR